MKASIAIIITLAFAAQSATSLLESAQANPTPDPSELVERVAQGPSDGIYRPIHHTPRR